MKNLLDRNDLVGELGHSIGYKFGELADDLEELLPDSACKTIALQKLVEAKDWIRRAQHFSGDKS